MNNHKGFAAVTALLVIFGVLVLGGAGYVAMNPAALQAPAEESLEMETTESEEKGLNAKSSIEWRFAEAGELLGTPRTSVTVVVDGTAYAMGTFEGSCSEIGASGGIDGTGLLAGELSAAQCWFAGAGNEIGVFAHEDGGYDLLVGELSEGAEGAGMFRGDFTVSSTILP